MEIPHTSNTPGKESSELGSFDDLNASGIHDNLILVIDDESVICEFIKACLMSVGFTNIKIAHDGLTGLNLFLESKPDLVILDLQMPIMDGFELLKTLRSESAYDDIPIIVQTAMDSTGDRNAALKAGATNIISKPLDFDILIHRVEGHLEHRLLVQNLKTYRQRVQQELDAARSMQLQLLPRPKDINEIESAYRLQLDWHYHSSSELGGDWWGIKPIDDNHFAIFAADFTGHGVGAAINTFRLHMIMSDITFLSNQPSQYLGELNDLLVERIPRGQFATMFFAVIDIGNDTLTYASAGHTSPMIGSTKTGDLHVGDPSGLPLGIKKAIEYTDHTFPFNPDDVLFVYSDALIETAGSDNQPALDGDVFTAWVRQTMCQTETTPPLAWLLDKFYAYADGPPPDDVTTIWVRRHS